MLGYKKKILTFCAILLTMPAFEMRVSSCPADLSCESWIKLFVGCVDRSRMDSLPFRLEQGRDVSVCRIHPEVSGLIYIARKEFT